MLGKPTMIGKYHNSLNQIPLILFLKKVELIIKFDYYIKIIV